MIIITQIDTTEITFTRKSEKRTCIDDDRFPQKTAGAPADGPIATDETLAGADEQAGRGDDEDTESAGKRWTAEHDRWLKKWHESGLSQKDIAEKMGVDRRDIRIHMRRLRLPTSRRYPAQSTRRGTNAKP
jgi:hypothetical protein